MLTNQPETVHCLKWWGWGGQKTHLMDWTASEGGGGGWGCD